MNYRVVEKFVSINGEGTRAGQLAVFIRFAGCNLQCSYCDTAWANVQDVTYQLMSSQEICNYIKDTKVHNVTLTGGEPLLQNDLIDLLRLLSEEEQLYVEIETNGSISLSDYKQELEKPPAFTMDYKLPSSCMEDNMIIANFSCLTIKDTLKFVVGSMEDLDRVDELIKEYDLVGKTNIYISPVYGKIVYAQIVDFMKDKNLNGVNFQLQLHKVIWNPEERGV